jgi:hypothetical protein
MVVVWFGEIGLDWFLFEISVRMLLLSRRLFVLVLGMSEG